MTGPSAEQMGQRRPRGDDSVVPAPTDWNAAGPRRPQGDDSVVRAPTEWSTAASRRPRRESDADSVLTSDDGGGEQSRRASSSRASRRLFPDKVGCLVGCHEVPGFLRFHHPLAMDLGVAVQESGRRGRFISQEDFNALERQYVYSVVHSREGAV